MKGEKDGNEGKRKMIKDKIGRKEGTCMSCSENRGTSAVGKGGKGGGGREVLK